MKKKKIFVISDHPFSPSGVGSQTKYFIQSLISTGDYSFICFGGAIRHADYKPQKIEPYGDDWVVYPVDNYGTQETVRSIIRTERPDIVWFMTDPRFFPWLWEIEDEIRSLVPMVYYHVWDNYPYPDFNKIWYDSCDHVACISKVTHDIVKTVSPTVDSGYLPHAVDSSVFKPLSEDDIAELKNKASVPEDKFIVFWNNRNARRKHPGTLIFWFKQFLDKIGHDKAQLIMHTDPRDVNGPDLIAQINKLGLVNGEVQFSKEKINPDQLAALYNMSDVTVNISDAEGFGLATLESLSCGTPIIVNMTGGLQEQVTNGEEWFGIGIQPSSKSIIGSQDIPYIYEDRINEDDFINALEKIYNMSREERASLGMRGREHVQKNYNFEKLQASWRHLIDSVHDKFGSWDTRKNYKNWEMIEA
jgi:glycosyltransferase involved in cell wall biosynthesis|tara:strand:+ start:2663 stop:3913 length:1251 start_codon:yes stop_codon:yes gene_type:complete